MAIRFVDMMDDVLELALETKLGSNVPLESQSEDTPSLEQQENRGSLTN